MSAGNYQDLFSTKVRDIRVGLRVGFDESDFTELHNGESVGPTVRGSEVGGNGVCKYFQVCPAISILFSHRT